MDAEKRIIVGARGSKLSLAQTGQVVERLRELNPGMEFSIEIIKTTGDRVTDRPLAQVGGTGLFVKEIEDALRQERIDLAIHSLKDVTTAVPGGLTIGVVTERVDCRDALLTREGVQFAGLPQGAVVGTSSLRRRAQLLHARPDLDLKDLRGNLDTRLARLDDGSYDAIMLAAAGLGRMGWEERISDRLDPAVCLPAVGQGALGLEIRENDERVGGAIAGLEHGPTRAAVTAERSLLRELEGGCQAPIAAWGREEDGRLTLDGMVASIDGKELLRRTVTQEPGEDPDALGVRLAGLLRADGADGILEKINRQGDTR